MTTTIDLDLRARVEAFLIHETALLDERRYPEWIDLFTPDGVYWVPANRDDTDPKTHVSLIYDNVARLKERLVRADSGMFWAQDPPTRATRVIGNLGVAPDGADLLATCKLVLVTQRRGQSQTLSGTCAYQLAPTGDDFRIRRKTVLLIQNDEPQLNLTFLP
ncbi:MAG: aromatic-ring-hydroxylating dioxygenase subunit beta [Immundisolibacter sp.]|uniref:aromatic-ring-hydroxylating dioxygenase subunit beta n=1 Tax=Immundisolibacter sp. TaxID=1934948 RepID=UPI003D14DBAA